MSRDYRAVIGSVKGLRRGLTTGSWAQAAAKAAALSLVSGAAPPRIDIRLPESKKPYSGASVRVPIVSYLQCSVPDAETAGVRASCVKDAGDDVDATHGMEIGATAYVIALRDGDEPVRISGGKGVGIVQRHGLPVAQGEAAINPVPREMIRRELSELMREARTKGRLGPDEGLAVIIDVPAGEETAKKTWNPRIGVSGGISIIGTCGVVEPKSSSAFRKTIDRTFRAQFAQGVKLPVITPGYVGERYLTAAGVPDERIIAVGDHIGFALKRAKAAGFSEAFLVGHLGKIVKIAAGLFNTHSKYGDARLETIAAAAAACGADTMFVKSLLSLTLAEEAVPLITRAGLPEVFAYIARRAALRSEELSGLSVPCVILALDASFLGAYPAGTETLLAGGRPA